MSRYLDAVRERVVIFDGATGTNIQLRDLQADDFGSVALEGCNEVLVDTRPDVIEDLHRSFLALGCDVVETDTFGGFATVLNEYGLAHRVREVNRKAAGIAGEVVRAFGDDRWVAGSMGPGTKFPSLGQIPFTQLRDEFQEQAEGLLEGGVDLLVVETVFDLLEAKAAIAGARRAMAAIGREVPIQVQVTMELTGRMLPGTEIGAALTAWRRCGPTSSASTAPPAPARWASTCAICRSTRYCRSRACPMPGCPRWSRARCTTTSRPISW